MFFLLPSFQCGFFGDAKQKVMAEFRKNGAPMTKTSWLLWFFERPADCKGC
jgi:hypothetical protein